MPVASIPLLRAAQLLLIAVLLTGCGGNQAHRILNAYASGPVEGATAHTLLIATTRDLSDDPQEVYGGRRGDAMSYARVDMSVPPDHVTGRIERPYGQARADPAQHFAATRIGSYHGTDEFRQGLRDQIRDHDGRALVFIHGYRTRFDSAAYRATQVVHDSGYQGAPVLFSWASAGRTVDYIYDNNSATIARDSLEELLGILVDEGATRIDIVAHSMGNWVMMETLRQMSIRGDDRARNRLGDVVMASPDIDVDVFKSQLSAVGQLDRPIVVLVSGDDRALQASAVLAGNLPRVGDYSDAQDLAALGVVVVDVSGLESGNALNHSRFADNPLMIELLGDRLSEDLHDDESGQIGRRLERLTQGVGQTVGTAAEIIVTTPLEVINIATGQR